MIIDNRTPHDIEIKVEGAELKLEGSKEPARVKNLRSRSGGRTDIPVHEKEVRDVRNLPDEGEDQVIIMTKEVREACPEREDLYMPSRVTEEDQVIE